MIGWGLSNGQWSAATLAQRARNAGFKCASLEFDFSIVQDEQLIYPNKDLWPAFRSAMIDAEIVPGVWFTDSWNIGETPADAYFTVGEIESEGDRQGVLHAPAFSVPKAVLISGTAFTDSSGVPQPEKATPLINAGWKCLVECYRNETTDYPPDMIKLATEQLGWPRAQPIFGIHNAPLSHFEPWKQGGWGIYLGEYLL